MNPLGRLAASTAPPATVLIRLMVGAVFLSEGLQKFLFPGALGVGRFLKIGLPHPELLAPMVGAFEVICGCLVLVGLLTRLATVPLITIMVVAIITTKLPILLDRGLWAAAHESRTDLSMLLGSMFLLLVGAGPAALDRLLAAGRRGRR
jgi:putative oxidoreductase